MNNDTALILLVADLQRDKEALRQRIVELEQSLAGALKAATQAAASPSELEVRRAVAAQLEHEAEGYQRLSPEGPEAGLLKEMAQLVISV